MTHRPGPLRPLLVAALAAVVLSCARAPEPAEPIEPLPDLARADTTRPLAIPPLPLPPRVHRPDDAAAEPGLTLRLREGATDTGRPGVAEPGRTGPAPAEPLSIERTNRLLARLPALPTPDTAAFRFPAASPPPPRTGRVVLSPFPPADSLEPPAARPARPRGPLRVVRILPSGETELAPHLTITFSDAMVPLTTIVGTLERTPPARLTPQPPGRWSWMDTRTLRFEPDGRFPMASTFAVEVPAGTRSAAGDALEEPVRAEFATPPVRAIGAYPALHPESDGAGPGRRRIAPYRRAQEDAGAVSLRPVVIIAFDQRVGAAAVLRRTRAFAAGRTHALRLATQAEVSADTVVSRLVEDLEDDRWLAVRPAEPLPGDADVRIVLGPGVPSAEGPRVTTRAQELRFRTYGPLKITWNSCLEADTCRPGQTWRIRLSNPIDESAWSPDLVRVEPALKDMAVHVRGAEVWISGEARPNTRYTATLSPSVRDRFGQRLQEPRSVTFVIGAPLPMIRVAGTPLIVLDPEGPPRVNVHSHGVGALRVRVYRVSPEQWFDYGDAVERWLRAPGGILSPPGEEVLSRVVEVEGGGTEFSETVLDVSAALRDGLGHAIVVVEPVDAGAQPDPRAGRGWRRTANTAWVQSTRIGLAARADAEELFVWATSLRSGQPLGDVDLTVLPTGRHTATAGDGTARIALSESGDAALVAASGADAALLPAREYAFSRGRHPWQRRREADELRWYTLTDRGLYQPGETVHFKGWLRRMPHRPANDPEIAGGVSGIDLTLRGPRNEDLATTTLRPGELGGFDTPLELPEALNLGHARIELQATGAGVSPEDSRGHHVLQVQEFRRPEHEVRVEADPGPHIVGDVVDVALNAGYYGGGGLADAPLDWRVTTRPGHYRPPGWDRWHFGRMSWWRERPRGGEAEMLSGVTDAAGSHRLHIDLVSVEPPFTTALRAEAQVSDLTRQIGSAGVDLIVHPAALSVGLRLERGWVHPGQTVELEVVVVDHDGRAVPGRSVEVALERLAGDRWARTPPPADSGRVVCRVETGPEPSVCHITPDSAGVHRVRADVRDDAARVSRTQLLLWVAGAPVAPDRRGDPGRMELVGDREEYQPGDTARILVQSPFLPAEALVTIHNGGVLSTERLRIGAPSYELEVLITEAHIPAAEVRVELVDAETGVDFATGVARLSVPPHLRALDVRVTPRDTVAAPGAETLIDLEVRHADGRPAANAEVALWMVDEAVLAIGGYSLNDPLDVFYAPRHTYMYEQHSRRWVVRWPRSAGPGTLSGQVLAGESGRALAGATVRLAGTSIEARTAFDGSFTLRDVPPGEYVLEITSPDGATGRRTVTVPADGVHVGNLVLGAFGLSAGAEILARRREADEVVAVAPAPPPPAPGEAQRALKLESVVVTGGGAAEQEVGVRTDFAPLAFFEPSLRTDANGRVRVTARLPESLTRYRIMAVAVSGAERFGTGEAALTARKELMVRLSAPRFLNYGDRFELPVLVQNATTRAMEVELAARASGLRMGERPGRLLILGPGERAEVRLEAAAPLPGTAHVQVVAVADDGTADAASVDVPVYTPATLEAFATYGTIDSDAPVVLPVARPRGVIEGFGGLEVSITSTALHSLTDAVLYLHRYPFEGAEHLASHVLAVAALRDVLSAFGAAGLPDPDALVAATQRDIAELVAAQAPDGGWAFWPGSSRTNPFVSIHVAHALQRAREKDFDVPGSTLERAAEYLRGIEARVAAWPLAARQSAAAYSLYVRHRIGDPAAQAQARRMASAPPDRVGGELPVEAAGWLLHVVAADPASRAEADALRRTLMNRLVETAGTVTFASRYEDGEHLLLHSRRRTDAVVLEALIAAGADDDVVTRLARSLLARRVAGRWSGTQENAWVLLALDRYFRTYEATTPAFASRVWLGDRFAGTHAFQGRTTDRQHISVPMPQLLRADSQELVIAREGAGRMYYRAGVRYAPADLRTPAADRGFEVTRVYEPVDDPADVMRAEDGTWHVRAGARVRVRVEMVAPSVRYHAALVDALPAGFEPLNPELRGTGFTDDPDPRIQRPRRGRGHVWRARWFEHQNLRDDRAEAFASLLPAGVYEYSYLARATTPGTFIVPPPRAEMMYQPETFGRGEGHVVVVEER
ncbi:MAG: carboxypeptidase regulatory-like domain-containing protein [Gemmatimonadetes bacterium]|nr:carboxypeptidase regulatory-like domain-containing protein [Gemmatimonadota bacterium]